MLTRTSDEWLVEPESAGVPCGPIRSVADVFKEPSSANAWPGWCPTPVTMRGPPVVSTFRFDRQIPAIDLPAPAGGANDEATCRYINGGHGDWERS